MALTIERVDTALYRVPLPRPAGNAFFTYTAFDYVVATIETGEAAGLGWSYTVGVGGGSVKALLDEIAPSIIGRDAREIAAIHADLSRRVLPIEGITASLAVAALDIALWDLCARHATLPLHEFIGARRTEARACATGIDLNYTEDELVAQVRAWVDAGYTAIKIKVGKPEIAEDVRRVEAVRAAIGADVRLMIDANEGWTFGEANRRIDAFRHLDIEFLEDPLPIHDVRGYRRLRSIGKMMVAGGERLSSLGGVHTLLTHGGVDVLRPDVCRLSGITEWLATAQLAESSGVLVAPHMVEEIALPLSCAVPNLHTVEHVPACNLLSTGVIRQAPHFQNGLVQPRSASGHGVSLELDVLEGHRVD